MYHVLRVVKQFHDVERSHVCHDSEENEFKDACVLAELLTQTHINDIGINEAPNPEYEGSYWFFTNNGSKVTYRVQKKWEK